MTIRNAEARLKPKPSEADRKALRAFWRGVAGGMILMLPLFAAVLWGRG